MGRREGRKKEEKGRPSRYRFRCSRYRVTPEEVEDSERGAEGQELNTRAETTAGDKKPAHLNPARRTGWAARLDTRRRVDCSEFRFHLRKRLEPPRAKKKKIGCSNLTDQFELSES